MKILNKKVLNHYLQFGSYTNPGCYKQKLVNDFPDDIRKIGLLVRKQCIHSATLKNGNTGTNKDLRYGDMKKLSWYRQVEDDIFPTASAMLAELYRRDEKGFILNRNEEYRLVIMFNAGYIYQLSILDYENFIKKMDLNINKVYFSGSTSEFYKKRIFKRG
jgi:hypothetical protein